MKNHIVGAFTPETWHTHGKGWLASVSAHKGKAQILVLYTSPHTDMFNGVEVVTYNGDLIGTLAGRDGVFLYLAPHVRLQSEPTETFAFAADKFTVVERTGSMQSQPFKGNNPVHESYWAAPSDLLDMLARVVAMSFGTGCKPPYFETNYVSYFTEFFPWFKYNLPSTEFASVYDAELVDDYYVDPKTSKRLTAVGIDKPEKKVGVFGSIVKPTKPSLTMKPKDTMIDAQVELTEDHE